MSEPSVARWQGERSPRQAELRAQLESEGFEVFAWSDPPGARYEPHTHDHDESLWIYSGDMVFGIGGRDFTLAAGDRLSLPGGTVHTAVAGERGASYLVGKRRA